MDGVSTDLGALAAENVQLRTENALLKQSLVEVALPTPASWRLSPTEQTIFQMLLKRDVISKDSIIAVLYGDREARPEDSVLAVFFSKLRRKTKTFGVEIRTIFGVGYQLCDRGEWSKVLKLGQSERIHAGAN